MSREFLVKLITSMILPLRIVIYKEKIGLLIGEIIHIGPHVKFSVFSTLCLLGLQTIRQPARRASLKTNKAIRRMVRMKPSTISLSTFNLNQKHEFLPLRYER